MKGLQLLCIFALIAACAIQPGSGVKKASDSGDSNPIWHGFTRLSGDEISRVFSNVLDRATVVDGLGGAAINYWYQNGSFTSNWNAGDRSGQLSGSWFVKNAMRCVIIDSSPTGAGNSQEMCGPIYWKEGKYYSVNKQGLMHGIHILSNLDLPANR